jgi:quinol monooxygenase YgiN
MKIFTLGTLIVTFFSSLLFANSENSEKLMVRMSEIKIYPEYLDDYKSILKKESNASVKLEAGVISIYPMFMKENPSEIRILEIYANEEAYKSHLLTPHFKEYKTQTLKMVESLKLIDMDSIDKEAISSIFKKY